MTDILSRLRAEYLARARIIARTMADDGPITVDDIRVLCPPPASLDGRVMGSVFRPSEWEAAGFCKSTRSVCHGRPIRQFRRREQAIGAAP